MSAEVVQDQTSAIARSWRRVRQRLLDERCDGGWWEGELSSSALSTATACAALALEVRARGEQAVTDDCRAGWTWLAEHSNSDGGYGDTTDSPSNLSTTVLSWMSLGLSGGVAEHADARARAERWLVQRLGRLDPERLANGLKEVYADDHTFAVPILVACAAAGAFEEQGEDAWAPIARLPFELAAFPRGLFKWLGLPVVSYALPALIAIGQAIEHHRPSRNPFARAMRWASRTKTWRVLEQIQPEGGGFLEATPLTSFVVMSLVACEKPDHVVALRGVDFLRRSKRADGSWPIDTNLATWLTTLSIGALAAGPSAESVYTADIPNGAAVPEEARVANWLLDQQFDEVHPYTGAAAGGWAWTDLPGGVPDADDTAGGVLAAVYLGAEPRHRRAAQAGARWLCDLQNRDGGIPTFCRGWGKLPFDQSCPDLTAHALRAWDACGDAGDMPMDLESAVQRARKRAQRYLVRDQREEGSWVPLWFGNQEQGEQENPVYGTSRVLRASGTKGEASWHGAIERGTEWLLGVQAASGGFGGDAGLTETVEETALALEALNSVAEANPEQLERLRASAERAASYLVRETSEGTDFAPRPIGLYFAKLWYSEMLYPLIFTVSALGGYLRVFGAVPGADGGQSG